MYSTSLKELREYLDAEASNTNLQKEAINSLKIIHKELLKVKALAARPIVQEEIFPKVLYEEILKTNDDYDFDNTLQYSPGKPPGKQLINTKKSVFQRFIRTSLEYNLYHYLSTNPINGLPNVIKLDTSTVLIPFYPYNLTKEMLTDVNIVKLLNILKSFKRLNISHRAIHVHHILFGENKEPVIIDYGKAGNLGEKTNVFKQNPCFSSRNALLQNKCKIIDDLESLGYVILYVILGIELCTFESKNDFIKSTVSIENDKISKYFELINDNNENHNDYIKIFYSS